MSCQGRRRPELWLGALCSCAVVVALSSCTPRAPETREGTVPGEPAEQAAPQAAASSPLSAQQIVDELGLEWKHADAPVVVFHNPG